MGCGHGEKKVPTEAAPYNCRSRVIRSLTFASIDGLEILASADDDGIISLWKLDRNGTLTSAFTLTDKGKVFCVAFSHDGKTLASGNNTTGIVTLWDLKDIKPESVKIRTTLKGHTSRVFCVAFSPTDKLLVSGGTDKIIRLWDPDSGEEVGIVPGT